MSKWKGAKWNIQTLRGVKDSSKDLADILQYAWNRSVPHGELREVLGYSAAFDAIITLSLRGEEGMKQVTQIFNVIFDNHIAEEVSFSKALLGKLAEYKNPVENLNFASLIKEIGKLPRNEVYGSSIQLLTDALLFQPSKIAPYLKPEQLGEILIYMKSDGMNPQELKAIFNAAPDKFIEALQVVDKTTPEVGGKKIGGTEKVAKLLHNLYSNDKDSSISPKLLWDVVRAIDAGQGVKDAEILGKLNKLNKGQQVDYNSLLDDGRAEWVKQGKIKQSSDHQDSQYTNVDLNPEYANTQHGHYADVASYVNTSAGPQASGAEYTYVPQILTLPRSSKVVSKREGTKEEEIVIVKTEAEQRYIPYHLNGVRPPAPRPPAPDPRRKATDVQEERYGDTRSFPNTLDTGQYAQVIGGQTLLENPYGDVRPSLHKTQSGKQESVYGNVSDTSEYVNVSQRRLGEQQYGEVVRDGPSSRKIQSASPSSTGSNTPRKASPTLSDDGVILTREEILAHGKTPTTKPSAVSVIPGSGSATQDPRFNNPFFTK